MAKERTEWNVKMKEVVQHFSKIETISTSQVLMLSYRHEAVELMTKYKVSVHAKKSSNATFHSIRWGHYKRGTDQRYADTEIKLMVASDMALRDRMLNAIKSQIEFLADVVVTLDKLGYAISNRIELEKMHMI